jgi:hypothetical protein
MNAGAHDDFDCLEQHQVSIYFGAMIVAAAAA